MRSVSGWALVVMLAGQIVHAQTLPSETDRLLATGRLWIAVKYFDPAMAYRKVDWDQALVQALPKIRAAQTSAVLARTSACRARITDRSACA